MALSLTSFIFPPTIKPTDILILWYQNKCTERLVDCNNELVLIIIGKIKTQWNKHTVQSKIEFLKNQLRE